MCEVLALRLHLPGRMPTHRSHDARIHAVALGVLLAAACADTSSTQNLVHYLADAGPSDPLDPCGDADAATGAADASPEPPETPLCNAVLAPPLEPFLQPELLASGPWQRCGAYGSGAARVIRSSADGSRVAVVTDSGEAYVLLSPSLAQRGVFQHGSGRVGFAALSADGSRLATLNDVAGELAIWNVDTHELVRVIRRAPSWPSLYDLGDMVFSADGTRLAVASSQHLEVYDVASGTPLPISYRDGIGNGMRLAFVAGDTRLAVVRHSFYGNGPYAGWGRIDVMDATTGANQVTLPASYHIQLPQLATSGDGKVIAMAVDPRQDEGIHFFDAVTGDALAVPTQYGARLLGLSRDGAEVAVLEPSETVVSVRRVSDASLVRSVTLPGADPGVSSLGPLGVTPDLGHVLVGDDAPIVLSTVALADGEVDGRACGSGHDGGIATVSLSEDGGLLISTGAAGEHQVWNVATGDLEPVPPPAGQEQPSATSPDGAFVAVPSSQQGYFDVRPTDLGTSLRRFGPHLTRVVHLDWSPDGALIASGSERDPVDRRGNPVTRVWNVDAGVLQQQLESNGDYPALFHPDGDRLFMAGWGSVTLWCR